MQMIPFMHASFREIDIRFQFRYRGTYPKAIRLVSEGLVDLKPLVTHRFSLENGKTAFQAASTSSFKAIKVQIQQGHTGALPLRPRHRLTELLVHGVAVGKAGQRICSGQPLQFIIHLFQFSGALSHLLR